MLIVAVQAVALLLIVWQVVGLVRTASRNRGLARLVDSAPALQPTSPEGTFVKLEGELTSPKGRTPFGDQPCSWWHSQVKVVFQSKAKKPGRGLVTHKPRILIDSAEAMPLIVENPRLWPRGSSTAWKTF